MPSVEILDDKENNKSSESFFEAIEKLIEPKTTIPPKQQDLKSGSELLRKDLKNPETEGMSEQYKKNEQELLRKPDNIPVSQQPPDVGKTNISTKKA